MREYLITDFGAISDTDIPQTDAVQKAIDACRDNGGGRVVIPKGTFTIASVRIWSDTELYLQSGAVLQGSENCDDYVSFDAPEHITLRTDMEMIPEYYHRSWSEYRRAMIAAYGETCISIIGEEGSVIDGRDCFDPNGEEGFRGPHGIFLASCENVKLSGYTAQNCGNFMHELNCCKNVHMKNVTCLAGHDATHFHYAENVIIEDCNFMTGDDCIAGIGFKNVIIRRCKINTSCQCFRTGGSNMLVEDCHFYGPGYYPHRYTIVKGRDNILPREQGRHNTVSFMMFFASTTYPAKEPADNIVIRNCLIENVDKLLDYVDGRLDRIQKGGTLAGLTLENVRFTGLKEASHIIGNEDVKFTLKLKNTSFEFVPEATEKSLVSADSENVKIIVL